MTKPLGPVLICENEGCNNHQVQTSVLCRPCWAERVIADGGKVCDTEGCYNLCEGRAKRCSPCRHKAYRDRAKRCSYLDDEGNQCPRLGDGPKGLCRFHYEGKEGLPPPKLNRQNFKWEHDPDWHTLSDDVLKERIYSHCDIVECEPDDPAFLEGLGSHRIPRFGGREGKYRSVTYVVDGIWYQKDGHHLVGEIVHGKYPPTWESRHLCRRKDCCWEEHVVPGPREKNIEDRRLRDKNAPITDKLNKELVEEIHDALSTSEQVGSSWKEFKGLMIVLADDYGVSYNHIYGIQKGESWGPATGRIKGQTYVPSDKPRVKK